MYCNTSTRDAVKLHSMYVTHSFRNDAWLVGEGLEYGCRWLVGWSPRSRLHDQISLTAFFITKQPATTLRLTTLASEPISTTRRAPHSTRDRAGFAERVLLHPSTRPVSPAACLTSPHLTSPHRNRPQSNALLPRPHLSCDDTSEYAPSCRLAACTLRITSCGIAAGTDWLPWVLFEPLSEHTRSTTVPLTIAKTQSWRPWRNAPAARYDRSPLQQPQRRKRFPRGTDNNS
jgi:hypothetical protein